MIPQLSELDYLTVRQRQILAKAGLKDALDILFLFPVRLDNYLLTDPATWKIGEQVTFIGMVASRVNVYRARANLTVMTFDVEFKNRKIRVTIFNRQFYRKQLYFGKYVRLRGKFDEDFGHFVASDISFDNVKGEIIPLYGIKGISAEKFMALKAETIERYLDLVADDLPDELLRRFDLMPLPDAVRAVNLPTDMDSFARAVYRIKFTEFLHYQLGVKYTLYRRKHTQSGLAIAYDAEQVAAFVRKIPYKLTADQERSLAEILADLAAPYKMNRLLQGEVGSGKTVVAITALYAAVTAGYQGALMAPTEVLAGQHYAIFKKAFKDYPLKIAALFSALSDEDKREVLAGLKSGAIDIVLGTHALFQKNVAFKNLGLIVTDEEHRFGVRQRVLFAGKGRAINHLKMSATPIPRTLAISALGDADISQIKTLPANRKQVITRLIDGEDDAANWALLYAHIRQELAAGRQIYIITPMIAESEKMDLVAAEAIYEQVAQALAGEAEVGLIHGRLKQEQKTETMARFVEGTLGVLVATSVIEVGVNVANATTVIILDADRFGVAQLHQMRGRVQRSSHQSYCYLVSKSTVDTAVKRLKLVESEFDGFILAEADLEMRGQGDILGERQSGTVAFRLADLLRDKDIFERANALADELIETEALFTPEFSKLFAAIDRYYQERMALLE